MVNNLKLETMEFSKENSIALLKMTRETSLNAMNVSFFNNFKTVLDHLSNSNDGIRALIITGSGKGFCVGADLKDLPIGQDHDLGKSLRENFEPLIIGIKKLPFPTIAAVNGYAAGAGMGLMLACDFTIATKTAEFIQAFINIGLVPDAGSTYFLPRLVGRAKAVEMMMLGESFSADNAYSMGLIYKVCDDEKLMDEAYTLANNLAQKPTSTLIQIRELLDQSFDNSFLKQLEAEAIAQEIAGKTDNFTEGVKAFIEKRKAKFN